MIILSPQQPKDRFDIYRFFNGQAMETKEGLDRRHTRVPLVKTFLLEHVATHGNNRARPPDSIFKELGAEVKLLDDTFMALTFDDVYDKQEDRKIRATTGFLEQYDERFFAYYTCEDSKEARRRVSRWVLTPELDHAWFSSPLLYQIWSQDVSTRGDERYCKLVFKHDSIFDMPRDMSEPGDTADETEEATGDEENSNDERKEPERRKARFEMSDKIGRIKNSLDRLMANYAPLHALNSLRIPSRQGRGGHELFQTGQITNRADSFEDHRNIVRYLYRIYSSILISTEKIAWQSIDSNNTFRESIKGVPLIVKFEEPLSEATFKRWVQMAFQKRNQFKLWGVPIELGPTKVHVYGADRHLWQPINLEITSSGIVALLPQGTCGNTFFRLITNIQQYVCPKIKAWIGSKSFEDVVGDWSGGKEETDANRKAG